MTRKIPSRQIMKEKLTVLTLSSTFCWLMIKKKKNRRIAISIPGNEVVHAIKMFDIARRINESEDIFQCCHCQPQSDMKRLAKVAVALPFTQASVERTFSRLRYILSDLKLGVKEDIIDAIMIIRCNT